MSWERGVINDRAKNGRETAVSIDATPLSNDMCREYYYATHTHPGGMYMIIRDL